MFLSTLPRARTHESSRRQKHRPSWRLHLRVEELEQRRLLTLLPAPTTSTIGVLEDQLNMTVLSPEVTFAATHAAGTQKQTAALNLLYKAINPSWYLLHYQLGTGHSAYPYVINNAWSQDFDPASPNYVFNPPAGLGGVTSHEDWFEHSDGSLDPTTTGNRLVTADGYYLANIDSAGWRNYQAASLVQNMVASGAQGVFADAFTGPVSGYYTNQGDARYDYGGPIPGPADPSLWPGGETWLTKAANYIRYIQGQLTAAGEALYGPGNGFAYVPNVSNLDTGWADIDYSASKGLFAEAFAVWNQPTTGGNWSLAMNTALRSTTTSDPANADRMFIMQPYPGARPDSAEGLQERSWAMGSYLLLKGDHTYINMLAEHTASGLQWYPEYQVNLGAPQDPGGMPTTLDGYLDPASQLYVRSFEHGLVLVNNSDTTRSYDPGQIMQQVIVNGWGGGVRNGDIDPVTNRYVAGWLSSQLVSTVSVGPYSSVILINAGDPIEAQPPGAPPLGGGGSATHSASLAHPALGNPTILSAGDIGAAFAASQARSLEPARASGDTLAPDRDAAILANAAQESDIAAGPAKEPLSGHRVHIVAAPVDWGALALDPLPDA
jgi:hypothetical protein